MENRLLLLTIPLLLLPLAGCLSGGDGMDGGQETSDSYNQATGLFEEEAAGLMVQFAPGALSSIHSEEGATIAFPVGTILVDGDRLSHVTEVSLAAGEHVSFIPPPGISELVLSIDGTEHWLDASNAPDHARFLDGHRVVDFMQVWNDEFPDHNPGTQSYVDAGNWAVDQMESWGYDVAYDEYGSTELPQEFCVPVPVSGQQACPASLANVVGTKEGADPDAGIIVFGGHYDIVPQVTHGAWDNTGGTMVVMALAEALAPYTFDQTLIFALWGGEESGLLGSASWIASHPEIRANLNVYWNFDVVGGSWPAPLPETTPLHFEYGADVPNPGQVNSQAPDQEPPDPVEEYMRAWAMQMVDATQYDVNGFDYKGVVEGVATTDVVPFYVEGVPVFNPNSSPEGGRVARIHTESDTLLNFSKYALWGVDFDPADTTWPDEATRLQAHAALARSFDPYLWVAFQHIIHSDEEGFNPYIPA